MLDEETIAEYVREDHTGPHLPFPAPETEGPRPPAACPSAPVLNRISGGPLPLSGEAEQAPPEPETYIPRPETVLRRGTRKRRRGLNARKHGILASNLSGNERRRLNRLAARFAEDLRPVGTVEEALVEKIAITCLRLQRCAVAESVYHDATWRPRPGRRVRSLSDLFDAYSFEKTASLISRYDTSLTNQLTKLLSQLGRVQAVRVARAGAPAAQARTDDGGLRLQEDV